MTEGEASQRDAYPSLSTDPAQASRMLLELDAEAASTLFLRLSTDEQLRVLDATPDPVDREELYYLVPDCTELIRASRVESLLEIINTVFGTGLACGILSAVTPEQFAEMFERTAVHDGKVDPDTVTLWVAELTELEIDELSDLMAALDVELLAELFRGRIDVHGRYKGMAIDTGMVELEHVEFGDDEQARLLGELLWAADPELFIAMLRLLLTERDEGDTSPEEAVTDDDSSDSEDRSSASHDDWLTTLGANRMDTILPPVTAKKTEKKTE